jgi:hypothetical protein
LQDLEGRENLGNIVEIQGVGVVLKLISKRRGKNELRIELICEISDSGGGENEDDCLMGCCAV